MGTERDRAQRLERLVGVARFGELPGEVGEASDGRRAGPCLPEQLDVEGRQSALAGRQGELLCELPGPEQAHGARLAIGRELGAALERRQRDIAATAKPCSLRGL